MERHGLINTPEIKLPAMKNRLLEAIGRKVLSILTKKPDFNSDPELLSADPDAHIPAWYYDGVFDTKIG